MSDSSKTLMPARPRPRRWLRRLLILSATAILLYLFHAPLLRACAWFLISEDPPGPAEYVLPLEGGECITEAVRQCSTGDNKDRKLIILGRRESFAVRIGAMPSGKIFIERLLERHQGNKSSLIDLPCDSNLYQKRFAVLSAWLSANPTAHVILLCPRLGSAQMRFMLRTYLPPEALSRLLLQTVNNTEYDETNWWRHKYGLLDTLNSFLSYGYVRINGPTQVEKPTWDLDQYEKSLR